MDGGGVGGVPAADARTYGFIMVPNGQLALAVHLKDVGSSGVIHVVAQPRQSQNIDVEVIQVLLALFQVCQSVAALHH